MPAIEFKKTQTPKLTRRSFLASSSVCMSLPLLEAMLPAGKTAFAENATPTRLLTMFTGNGMYMPQFQPNSLSVLTSDFANATSLNPLLPLINDVTTIEGLFNNLVGVKNRGHGSGSASFLTCAKAEKFTIRTNISMDVVTANKIGHQTPIPLLHLGLEKASTGFPSNGWSAAYMGNISWQNPTTPTPKEIDPQQLFNRLFHASPPSTNLGTATDKMLNKSIIDAVLDDANRLQSRLGNADREQLQGYLASVRDLEVRLQSTRESCTHPTLGPNGNYVINSRLMNDLMVMAFTCDLTRVISYMFSNGLSARQYAHLGSTMGHHEASHHDWHSDKIELLRKIDTYHVQELADLCLKLKNHTDIQGRSLLDSCIVYYSSEFADGGAHGQYNLPVVLVGKGNGAVRSGRHIKLENIELANLYVTMMNAAGANVDSFGNSTGGLTLT